MCHRFGSAFGPVGAGVVRSGVGTLASPIVLCLCTLSPLLPGRRKRPLPTQPFPRPYGCQSFPVPLTRYLPLPTQVRDLGGIIANAIKMRYNAP